jgi:hypothetical protein
MGVHYLPPWRMCGCTDHTHEPMQLSEHVVLEGAECGCPLPHREVADPADLPTLDEGDSHCG